MANITIPIKVTKAGSNIITVTWDELTTSVQIADYELERSSDGENWVRANESPCLVNYFTESGLSTSLEYQYRIRALFVDGTRSDYSYSTYIRLTDMRVGGFFNNKDNVSNYHADGFGLIVTPDELRYECGFGNELIAPDGSTFTDDMLMEYIRMSITEVEKYLQFDIIPKQIRHRPYRNNSTGEYTERTDIADGEVYEWEDAYDYNPDLNAKYMYLKLRRKPVLEFQKAELRGLFYEFVMDFTKWAKVNFFVGSVEFYPYHGALGNLPQSSIFFSNYVSPYGYPSKYPDAFYVDYKVGYENASKVPGDLKLLILWMASIYLLNTYGDGKSPGLASASISLGGISESYATTQSATNALFGARIGVFERKIKDWMERNQFTYRGIQVGALGI